MCDSPPADRFPGNPGEAARLRQAAMRLADEFDTAGLYTPAAYVSMAVDTIVETRSTGADVDRAADMEPQCETGEQAPRLDDQ